MRPRAHEVFSTPRPRRAADRASVTHPTRRWGTSDAYSLPAEGATHVHSEYGFVHFPAPESPSISAATARRRGSARFARPAQVRPVRQQTRRHHRMEAGLWALDAFKTHRPQTLGACQASEFAHLSVREHTQQQRTSYSQIGGHRRREADRPRNTGSAVRGAVHAASSRARTDDGQGTRPRFGTGRAWASNFLVSEQAGKSLELLMRECT